MLFLRIKKFFFLFNLFFLSYNALKKKSVIPDKEADCSSCSKGGGFRGRGLAPNFPTGEIIDQRLFFLKSDRFGERCFKKEGKIF